jgi:hypothetical protein
MNRVRLIPSAGVVGVYVDGYHCLDLPSRFENMPYKDLSVIAVAMDRIYRDGYRDGQDRLTEEIKSKLGL